MDQSRYTAALDVLMAPNASDGDKAAAADRLTDFFTAQIDAQDKIMAATHDAVAALGVLIAPSVSDADKTAAADKLTAYFND